MNGQFLFHSACSMLLSSGFHSHYCILLITLSSYQHQEKSIFLPGLLVILCHFQFCHWIRSRKVFRSWKQRREKKPLGWYYLVVENLRDFLSLFQLRILIDFFIHEIYVYELTMMIHKRAGDTASKNLSSYEELLFSFYVRKLWPTPPWVTLQRGHCITLVSGLRVLLYYSSYCGCPCTEKSKVEVGHKCLDLSG